MASNTAPGDGVYVTDAGQFRIRKGRPMPEGANFVEDAADPKPKAGKRAKDKTAENRAKPDADENRSEAE